MLPDTLSALLATVDLSGLPDERSRALVSGLLNLVETLAADLRTAQAENQRLCDELNRLKGEQGKPTVKANTPSGSPPDLSSEQERRQLRERTKRRKRDQIVIDREQTLRVERALLPPDAEFKGYDEVVVQDLVVRTDNVLFRKEKFYSPAEQRSYLAALPAGYHGAFGPGVHALALVFAFAGQMTEPKIRAWFEHVGVQISAGQISNLLIKGQERFHHEKDAVYEAGLRSGSWQHIDDTATRVNGQNQHCHIIDNPLHTTYLTLPSKARLRVIDGLRNGQPRRFRWNADAEAWLEGVGVSQRTVQKLRRLPRDQDLDEATVEHLLAEHAPGLGEQTRKWVLDALAVAAYQRQDAWPVVRLLLSDGALQFTWLTDELALCWVHELRHYKKLIPQVPLHQQALERFLTEAWTYYRELLAYRQLPTPEERSRLETRFDGLFGQQTGYWALDERIGLTRAKKANLLMVLAHPELPLHNNAAELGARQRVRKRAISFGPRTPDGVQAWDTFMSLAATTRKLGVNFLHYVQDRIAEGAQIPPLAELIAERAKHLNLGASWAPV
ncbi:MAG: transposase [Chloroflexota bacterium]|nr:transposase [Chloroflexota bacterium]